MRPRPAAPGDEAFGSVSLFVAPSAESVQLAPGKLTIGAIRLRLWQVDRIAAPRAAVGEHDAYLVKVNYEFEFAPDAPGPAWVEVGFGFLAGDTAVLSALPRTVSERQEPRVYALSPQFDFAERDQLSPDASRAGTPEGSIAAPEFLPAITVSGVGGDTVRWRHTAVGAEGVRPALHCAWIVLLAPAGLPEMPVVALGRHDPVPGAHLELSPGSEPDVFTVRLRESEESAPVASAGGPRVFVSYAHDDERHRQIVQDFCDLLQGQGIDIRMDQWDLHRRRNWRLWIQAQFDHADFVVVVGSPAYRAAAEADVASDFHPGAQSEISYLAELLHRDRRAWTARILPVILPGTEIDGIPLIFQPYNADHYRVPAVTPEGISGLMEVLTGSPRRLRPRPRPTTP